MRKRRRRSIGGGEGGGGAGGELKNELSVVADLIFITNTYVKK